MRARMTASKRGTDPTTLNNVEEGARTFGDQNFSNNLLWSGPATSWNLSKTYA
jgi:hypothetical protein